MTHRRFVPILLITFAVAVLLGGPLVASVKWVDQAGGSDANDGDTEATAYATLQFAIDSSSPGANDANRSIINVKDGTYGVTGLVNAGTWPTAILISGLDFLTIQAVAGHEPVVRPVTAVAANIVSISVEDSADLIIDNIDSDQTTAQFDNWHVNGNCDGMIVRNSAFEGGEDGIDFNANIDDVLIENNLFKDITTGSGDEALDFTDPIPTNVVIQDNLFDLNYRHITLGATAANFIIRRNTMDGTNSEEAIRLLGPSDVLIENNVIMNNLQQGVYIDSGCSNITLQHNSFFNNNQEGGSNGEIRTKVGSADIVIKNNIMHGDGATPAIETSIARPLPGEDHNLVFNVTDTSFGPNTQTGVDPKFVSTTAGSEDLHLKAGSPALEAGVDLGVTDDHDKSSRPDPVATNPDKGAYEHPVMALPTMGTWALILVFVLLAAILARMALRRASAN